MINNIKKILLTGGTGMVGRNILDHDLSPQFDFIYPTRKELDLTDYKSVCNYVEKIKPDLVINCAAHVGGIQLNINQPVGQLIINTEINKNVIIASKISNIKNLINISSSCVYPTNAKIPFEESSILTGKLEPTNEGYSLTKIFSTRLCEYIMREDKSFNYKTIIPCNLYGYYDNFSVERSHALAAIIRKIYYAKKNSLSEVKIWGDGLSKREFLFSSDLADFIINGIIRFNDLPYLINVGLGKDFSINEYYKMIAKIFNWNGKFINDLSKPTGMKQKLVSIKLQEKFGWHPPTDTIDGITKTCNYYIKLQNLQKNFKKIKKCRVCGSKSLTEVISFPEQFLSPTFVDDNIIHSSSKIKVPLTVVLCDKNLDNNACGLLQLLETTKPELLYKNYFYRSSTNATMINGLKNVVENVLDLTSYKKNDIVVDIGANDGTMLTFFPNHLKRIGVEPAANINWKHLHPSINIVNNYFSKDSLKNSIKNEKVKIFTSCAMFYDLDDPNSFVSDISSLLDENGVFCIQLSYLLSMLKNMNFYDICHEHLEYYSLETLDNLMRRHELMIFDASLNDVNGGSVRVFITHVKRNLTRSENLLKLINEEKKHNLFEIAPYEKFYNKIINLSILIKNYINNKILNNELVVGLGASTKGNVLLQVFELNKKLIPFITEISKEKIGKKTLGTDIKLISDKKASEMNISVKLVLPWYFKTEIVKREKKFIKEGGVLLFPMPYAHTVTSSGEKNL